MTTTPIFTDWQDKHAALWGNQPLKLRHEINQSPLFSRDALADLIDRYPREHYALIHMGAQGGRRFWREGDVGNLPGQKVIDAIENGRMWINLRNVRKVDARYGELVEAIFQEIEARVPGLDTFEHGIGILISSPKAQVYYHADLPGQSLWQISGTKRVHIYPPVAPFLKPEHLEQIALFGLETDMPYEPWYDEHALVVDLEPGQMLHWPLNAPHRVENHDCLNVSMTIEYWTDDIRRAHIVNMANGILRHRLGVSPGGRSMHGPTFQAKRVLQRALRDTGWVKSQRAKRRPIEFKLDPNAPGAIIETAA